MARDRALATAIGLVLAASAPGWAQVAEGRIGASRPEAAEPARPDIWKHRDRYTYILGTRPDRDYGARLPERRRPGPEPEVRIPVPEPDPGPPPATSPRHRTLARGLRPEAPDFSVGEPLPEGRPHVTLDWRTYELPPPEPGTIYVRYRAAVLRIETGTRLVLERLDPAILP